MTTDNSPISFRLKNDNDSSFIYSCWMSSEKQTYPYNLSPSNLFYIEQRKKVDYLLNKSNTMMAYFMDENNKEVLISFMTYQFIDNILIVHYAFTKSPFRDLNIETNLLSLINIPNLPIILSSPINSLVKQNNVVFDPYYFQRLSYAN